MATDWTLTGSTTWALQTERGAIAIGDCATLTFSRTHTYTRTVEQRDEEGNVVLDVAGEAVEVDETREEVETGTAKHFRSSFGGVPQTDFEWEANIKREIEADLSGFNKVESAAVDITGKVTA